MYKLNNIEEFINESESYNDYPAAAVKAAKQAIKSIDPKHKNEPWKDNGYVSWLLWGGDSAYKWATDKIKELES